MVQPIGDRLVLRPIREENISKGGIFLPETSEMAPQRGVVLAVGPGNLNNSGERLPMSVEPDDEVIYNRRAGTPFNLDGVLSEELLLLRETDVMAVVERGD